MTTELGRRVAEEPIPDVGPRPRPGRRGFFWWGAGAYLLSMAALVVVMMRATGGSLIYPLDDTAIHLLISENLANHGTWGVVPGHFQSASSSPLWTVLLAGADLVIPFTNVAIPLVFNVLAGLWVVAALGADQRVLVPSRRRPLDGPAVAVLVVVILFLPGASILAMEHVLHAALALSALVLFQRSADGRDIGWPRWMPYLLLGLATVARLETAFLTVGLVAASLSVALWDPDRSGRRRWLPERASLVRSGLIALCSFGPLVVLSLTNRAMGQGFLPNSVLAKAQGVNGADGGLVPITILNRLTRDSVLCGVTIAVLVALLLGWGRRRFVFGAIAVAITVVLHVIVADVGWYDRYQTYLVILCAFVLLSAVSEVAPVGVQDTIDTAPGTEGRPRVRVDVRRTWLVGGLTIVALLVCGQKVSLTWQVGRAVSDTYTQRYQAGRFLDRYYDGEPIATGELGYIGLQHEGPITDLLGLGDYEVLEARRSYDQRPPKEYWAGLGEERGFDVAAVYPTTLWFDVPDEWILVGDWTLDHPTITAFDPTFQFWATRPEEVAPLQEHLREFDKELPDGATTNFNEFATIRAERALAGQ